MKNLAIIPARSGSKGVVDKNIKILNGKPLIAWTIEAAKSSSCFDDVVVSTDSELYSKIAIGCGASVPFLRCSELSTDIASTVDVIFDCLSYYKKKSTYFDNICLLQPTSPLRNAVHINESYQMFCNKKANTIVSVCKMEHSPQWSGVLDENGSLDNFIKPEFLVSRQNLDQYYRLNGAIYWSDCNMFYKYKRFVSLPNSYAYIMDSVSSVDIDTELDFLLADTILKNIYHNNELNNKLTM